MIDDTEEDVWDVEFDVNFICQSVLLSINVSLELPVQKNANFSPKAPTKERSKPSSKHCIYLVCVLHIKPKFKAFLPSPLRNC